MLRVLVLALCAAAASALEVYGAEPGAFDSVVDTFECDGGRLLPVARINDDYCDCSDGSDEPGTSACGNGAFFCLNRGHSPELHFSSRVNDGVCDCCDGSDEYSGRITCQNSCLEVGRAAREELAATAQAHEEGFAARAAMVQASAEAHAQRLSELAALASPIAEAEAALASLEAAKAAAEAAEAAEKAAAEAAAGEAAGAAEAEAAEPPAEAEAEAEAEPEPEAEAEEKEETEEERGQRIARQWTNDAAAAGPTPDQLGRAKLASVAHHGDSAAQAADDQPAEAAEEGAEAGAGLAGRLASTVKRWVSPKADARARDAAGEEEAEAEAAASPAAAEAQRLREEHSRAQRALSELTASRDELQSLVVAAGGGDGALLALAGQCFELPADAYTYKMCPFGAASQEPGGTSLGSWEGILPEGAALPTGMKFSGGLACWNGPQRSLTVDLACGPENKMVKVDEPNRCEYLARFETPAGCTPEAVAAARAAADEAWALVNAEPAHTEL